MLRMNGEGAPVGDQSEIRAGVAIIGGGVVGAVAAATICRQVAEQSVVIIDGYGDPLGARTLPLEDVHTIREIGLARSVSQPQLMEYATGLGATFLSGVAVERVESSANGVDRLHLSDSRTIVADWFVDTRSPTDGSASGENCLSCGGARNSLIGLDAGYTVAALSRGGYDRSWLLWSFDETTRRRLSEFERYASDKPLELHRYNIVKPNLVGAQQGAIAKFHDGQVDPVPCYKRDGRVLPMTGVYAQLLEALKHHTVIADLLIELQQPGHAPLEECLGGLESMLQEGWLLGRLDRRRPLPEWASNAKPIATISTFVQSHQPIRE